VRPRTFRALFVLVLAAGCAAPPAALTYLDRNVDARCELMTGRTCFPEAVDAHLP
jgi:hypothetical protein